MIEKVLRGYLDEKEDLNEADLQAISDEFTVDGLEEATNQEDGQVRELFERSRFIQDL